MLMLAAVDRVSFVCPSIAEAEDDCRPRPKPKEKICCPDYSGKKLLSKKSGSAYYCGSALFRLSSPRDPCAGRTGKMGNWVEAEQVAGGGWSDVTSRGRESESEEVSYDADHTVDVQGSSVYLLVCENENIANIRMGVAPKLANMEMRLQERSTSVYAMYARLTIARNKNILCVRRTISERRSAANWPRGRFAPPSERWKRNIRRPRLSSPPLLTHGIFRVRA